MQEVIPYKRKQSNIFVIRNQKGMPDRHFVEMYELETGRIKRAV